jgi:hypothetical protein
VAKSQSEKCRQCAKLSIEQAIAKHGPEGTNCFEGDQCHKRRTYYKNRDRYNKQRRAKYRLGQGQGEERDTGQPVAMVSDRPLAIAVPTPQTYAAILHLYRARVGDPLHAIGVELWYGGAKVAFVDPVHTLGWSQSQVKNEYLRDVLKSFSEYAGGTMAQFETPVEHHPETCPIVDCPLRSDVGSVQVELCRHFS